MMAVSAEPGTRWGFQLAVALQLPPLVLFQMTLPARLETDAATPSKTTNPVCQ